MSDEQNTDADEVDDNAEAEDCGCDTELTPDEFRAMFRTDLMTLAYSGFHHARDSDDMRGNMMIVLEEIALALGCLDAIGCLHGIPQIDRISAIHSIQEGRQKVQVEHDAECPGCPEGKRLRDETRAQGLV